MEAIWGVSARHTMSGPPGSNPGSAAAIVVTVGPSPSLAHPGTLGGLTAHCPAVWQVIIKAEPTGRLVSPVRTMAMDALSYT